MKKLKLLSSISAFLLIFSLSSCEEVEETIDDDGESSESSESSDSSESSETSSSSENLENDSFTSPNDMLSYIQEDNNYTITIQYHEVFSHYYNSYEEAKNAYNNGTMELGGFTYYVNILFTNETVLMEYYYSESTFTSGIPDDIELYINGDGRTEVYYPDSTNGGLYHAGAYTQGIFQEVFSEYTLMSLISYSDYITLGQKTSGDSGVETECLIDLEVSGLVPQLVYSLFHGYNWFVTSDQVYGPKDVLNLYNNNQDYYEYSSTFYNDLLAWYTSIITYAIYWTNSSGYTWLEQDYMYSSVYNVGETTLPSEYSQYL